MVDVFAISAIIGGMILLILVLRALWIMRAERDAPRGAEPGTGDHVLSAHYHSGGGGGGETREYRVPRDPQKYARLFVPKSKHATKEPRP